MRNESAHVLYMICPKNNIQQLFLNDMVIPQAESSPEWKIKLEALRPTKSHADKLQSSWYIDLWYPTLGTYQKIQPTSNPEMSQHNNLAIAGNWIVHQ